VSAWSRSVSCSVRILTRRSGKTVKSFENAHNTYHLGASGVLRAAVSSVHTFTFTFNFTGTRGVSLPHVESRQTGLLIRFRIRFGLSSVLDVGFTDKVW